MKETQKKTQKSRSMTSLVKIILLFFIATANMQQAVANEALADETLTGEAMTLEQLREENPYVFMKEYAQEFANTLNYLQLSNDVAYKLSGNTVNDNCVALMNAQMYLGSVGAYAAETFVKNKSSLDSLYEGGSLKRDCRKYTQMTDKEKSMVWVLILASMAHFESSCNTKASAKGPNGTAYGYFQLHKGKEDQYDGAGGLCAKGDAGDAKRATRCSLDMIDHQFKRDKGELFSRNSYWCVLRPQGVSKKSGLIKRALQTSSLCNPRSI